MKDRWHADLADLTCACGDESRNRLHFQEK